jgi:hypothetical protein
MRLTEQQIEAGRSPKGGWNRKQLAAWGVPWPPPKGWRIALTCGRDPMRLSQPARLPDLDATDRGRIRRKTQASDFPNMPLARFYFRTPYQSRHA